MSRAIRKVIRTSFGRRAPNALLIQTFPWLLNLFASSIPAATSSCRASLARGRDDTIHDASATGVSVSGIFQAAEDFAVLGFYNAYDYFNHLRQKHLPRTDLSGLILEFDIDYDHALDGAMRLDAAKYPSVSWDAMTFVCGKGGPGEIHEVKLLDYATVVSGGETPASPQPRGDGRAGRRGPLTTSRSPSATRFTIASRGARSMKLPKSLSAPNWHHRPVALRSRPCDRRVGAEGRGHGLLHVRPALRGRRPVRGGGDLPRYRRLRRHGGRSTTQQPHGGPSICRSYAPGPFNIVAAVNDTLSFHIDGIGINLTLSPGATQTADQVAGELGAACSAAGAEVVVDTVDECVRITSTKPVGSGEIIPWGGTAQATVGFPSGVWCGRRLQLPTSTPSATGSVCGQEHRGHHQWRRVPTSPALVRTSPA